MANCSECRFYISIDAVEGECKRFPPVMTKGGMDVSYTKFPIVKAVKDDNECGEYKVTAPPIQ